MSEKTIKIPLNDEQHIVYVNGEIMDDTPLGKLMADLQQSNPDKMHYSLIADCVREHKSNKKGASNMAGDIEKVYKEGIADGKAEGIRSLAKYLKKSSSKAEAVKQLMAVFGISESEAKRSLAAA